MYKALVSFAGANISGKKGAVISIEDKAIADDLIRAGYIVEEKPVKEEVPEKKEVKKTKK